MFEKSYVPLHGGRGVKNCQNHPYVINEWSLMSLSILVKIFELHIEAFRHYKDILNIPSRLCSCWSLSDPEVAVFGKAAY